MRRRLIEIERQELITKLMKLGCEIKRSKKVVTIKLKTESGIRSIWYSTNITTLRETTEMITKALAAFALVIFVITAQPAMADPEGTKAGAQKEIARYKRQHRKIKYYPSWKSAEAEINEMAYCYEGMQLGTNQDFMKNHAIMVICHSKKRKGSNVALTEEVIYPVWSSTNHAHVLRAVIFERTVPVSKEQYKGIDGKTHKL